MTVFRLYQRTLGTNVLHYDRPILLDLAILYVQAIVTGVPGPNCAPTRVMLSYLLVECALDHAPHSFPACMALPAGRCLLLSAFLVGLALTNYLTSGLVIPAGLPFVGSTERRKLMDARLALKGSGLFLVCRDPGGSNTGSNRGDI